MSISASETKLSALTKELHAAWGLTQERWRDQQAHVFEKEYLNELTHQVDQTLKTMDKLDAILRTVRRDCE